MLSTRYIALVGMRDSSEGTECQLEKCPGLEFDNFRHGSRASAGGGYGTLCHLAFDVLFWKASAPEARSRVCSDALRERDFSSSSSF